MQQVTVTGRIIKPDLTPWVGAGVVFTLTALDYTLAAQHPSGRVVAKTAEDGAFSVILWANGSGELPDYYTVTFPDKTQADFSLSDNTPSIIPLSQLLELGIPQDSQKYSTILDYLTTNINQLVEPIAVAAAQGANRLISFTNLTLVSVSHNLGYYPDVRVQNVQGDEITGAVENPDRNNFNVVFNIPVSGTLTYR